MSNTAPFKKGQQVQFKQQHQALYGSSKYEFQEINNYARPVAVAVRPYKKGDYSAQRIVVSPDMIEAA